MPADVLVVSPHPDDAELGCGGTVRALTAAGHSAVVCYLTRGEMGTRGDEEIRAAETAAAVRILGAAPPLYAGLQDSRVMNDPESRLQVVKVLRQVRPTLVLAPYRESLHPDHVQAAALVRDAIYLSGLLKLETGQERFRPTSLLRYPLRPEFDPSIVVDISDHFEAKMEAIRAHRSQFYDPASPDAPQTLLSAPDFLDRVEVLSRYFGGLIGARYGEAFRADLPIGIRQVSALMNLPFPVR